MKNTTRLPISRRKFLAGAAAVGISFKLPKDAFAANEFIMDYLKVKAPFWKKEKITDAGQASENWLDAKNSDTDKAELWS